MSALQRHWGPKVDNPVFMQRLQARVGVNTRHLALPIEEYNELKSWGKANNHWIDVATELGEKALCGALTRSGFAPSDLGAIFFVSITGISSPSIDARLINKMNLPVNINYVYGLSDERPQDWMPSRAYFGLLLIVIPLAICGPAHLALLRFFPRVKGEDRPNREGGS